MEQLEKDVEWLKANIKHLHDGQVLMQEAISKLTETVSDIASLHNDVSRHADEINLLRTRYHEQATFISARPCRQHDESISRLVTRADNLEKRTEAMETAMPVISFMSGTAFKVIVATIALSSVSTMAMNVLHLGVVK